MRGRKNGRNNIDKLLRDWPYDPRTVSVRLTEGDDGRDLIQMRIDMGVLQLEVSGRPDGTRPEGRDSYFDYLQGESLVQGAGFTLTEEQCAEVDREFIQFYHRRICWLKLQKYRRAVGDADHTLGLMDLCRECSPDERWTVSHEQYRPFVLFHRTQAAALAELEDVGPQAAVREIDGGLERLREVFSEHEAEDQFEDDELVLRLAELRSSLREQFDDRARLQQELDAAVAAEKYELAAELRDKLASLQRGRR
ncbi:MAG: UvrB/UvrC motif-containing protein [Pirellulaceae bacterium]|nr:UvrB/UvrC motif-containing protein [Pirellulaceae bacterium]